MQNRPLRPLVLVFVLVLSLLGSSPALAAEVPAVASSPEAQAPLLGPDPRLRTPGLLVPSPRVPGEVVPPTPDVPAAAWIVADLDTGEVLAARDARVLHAPASTLKVLTALALRDEVPLEEQVTVSAAAAGTECSCADLVAGHAYSAEDLYESMLTLSGNNAANALGETRPDSLALLNAKAQALGMEDTHAASFSGLTAPGQTTSVHDLAVLFREALEDPFIAATVGSERVPFRRHNGEVVQMAAKGRFLGVYPGALGGKTGFTNASRNTFVGAAERDGTRLVAAVLRTESGVGAQTGELLDWGFLVHGRVEPVGQLRDVEAEEAARQAAREAAERAARAAAKDAAERAEAERVALAAAASEAAALQASAAQRSSLTRSLGVVTFLVLVGSGVLLARRR